MSYQTNSALVNAQAKLIGAFQSGELRFRDPATYKVFLQSTPIMFPNYLDLRSREDRPVDAKYTTRSSRALGTGRSHNHTGTVGASGSLTPSWTAYHDNYTFTLKQGDNNVYTLDEMVGKEVLNMMANHVEGHETTATNYAFNNRSGVNGATVEGTFDATDDVFKITETTNGQRAVQIAKQVMHINKYSGDYIAICDTVAYNKFEYSAFQDSGTNANLSFQFNGVQFVHSVELYALFNALVGAYTKGSWIMIPRGMVGVLPWIPKQNREGASTSVNQYGTLLNPVDGVQYAVHSYQERVDGTATGGYTQDVKTEVQTSLDLAFVHAPLSTANETPLQAFTLV